MCSAFWNAKSAPAGTCLVLILLALLSPASVFAQSDAPIEYRIRIDDAVQARLGETAAVSIIRTDGNLPIEAFNFLISYNIKILSFLNAEPGETIDDDVFEYFNWHIYDPVDSLGLVRISGVRDIDNGVTNPVQEVTDLGGLATMNFLVTQDETYDCYLTPIQFYWRDCGDNKIVAVDNGETVNVISDRVYSYYFATDFTDPTASFPTFGGAPTECIDPSSPDPIIRFANLFEGGINIHCHEVLDDRGDVNLNGIAYEISDFVTFLNYIMYGNSAFTINFDAQIYATDVYPDLVPLTLNDYVYFIRVIQGEALPYAPNDFINPQTAFSGAVASIPTDSSVIIRSQFEQPVGGLHFTFYSSDISSNDDFSITKFSPLDYINLVPFVKDDSLHVLVCRDPYPPDTWPDPGTIESDLADIFEIHSTGIPPQLIHVEAAGYLGELVNVVIAQLPNTPPVFDSYPTETANNPDGTFYYDFDATDSDNPVEWIRYKIANGPGEIDSLTGEYRFTAVCGEAEPSIEISICAGDGVNNYPYIDPSHYAVMTIDLNYVPVEKGDINRDNSIDILDIQSLIDYLYRSGEQPGIIESADIDNNGIINILDIIRLINYAYKDGPAPACD